MNLGFKVLTQFTVQFDCTYFARRRISKDANLHDTATCFRVNICRVRKHGHYSTKNGRCKKKKIIPFSPLLSNFVKNVVSQYVATATSTGMYSNITLGIVKAAKPYLTYRSDKIAAANDDDDNIAAATATGQLNNGDRFELKNLQMDVTKDYLAKIYEVQMNNMESQDTAAFRLRLLDAAGQCDWSVTKSEEGAGADAGKFVFEFDMVDVAVTLNFSDKTAHVDVEVEGPSADLKNSADSVGTVAAWTNAKERLTDEFVRYFVTTLARAVDHNVRDAM